MRAFAATGVLPDEDSLPRRAALESGQMGETEGSDLWSTPSQPPQVPDSPARRSALRLRHGVREILVRHPALYLPLARARYPAGGEGRTPVRRTTEIVIEGFPRSANSFAVTAFQLAQGRSVDMAHHLHAPAQVIAAARWKIPTVVLIRDPDEAACSLAIRAPSLDLRIALRQYARFYERILPFRDDFVLAPFQLVVSNFGAVIEQVNRRFGSRFEPFAHDEANVRRCFELIEQRNQALFGRGNRIIETSVARPSPVRERPGSELRAELEGPTLAEARRRALGIYRRYMDGPAAS
jgi:hypothetical protein